MMNGILHYTFEYPDYYENISTVPYSYWSMSVLSASARIKSDINQSPDSYLSIETYNGYEENNLSDYIDDFIQKHSLEDSEFKLIKRKPVTITNIPGEYIEYSNISIISWSNEKIQQLHREAYIMYSGILVKIRISCIKNVSSFSESDFIHILETFAILERENCADSCTSNDLKIGESNIYFKYPCCYENSLPYFKNIYYQLLDIPEILLTRYTQSGIWASWINVNILNDRQLLQNDTESDHLHILQEYVDLDTSQSAAVETEYSIIEQSWIRIDGQSSIKIVSKYSNNKFSINHVWPILDETPVITRSVYFLSDGIVYKLSVVSTECEAVHDKQYFDEIINSIRIIDLSE